MAVPTTLLDVATQWPGWKVWRSSQGEYVCATRKDTNLPKDALGKGLELTLVRDSIPDLVDALQEQAEREAACR